MLRAPDPTSVERLLGGDGVVALVPVTPHDVLPDTVRAVVARSLGLRRRAVAPRPCWHDAGGAFAATAPPADLGSRRQVLLALTASNRLAVIGLDRLGRPVEVVRSMPLAAVEHVAVEPARLLGVATEALVIGGPDELWRLLLARPHRRSARALAALVATGVRYSTG